MKTKTEHSSAMSATHAHISKFIALVLTMYCVLVTSDTVDDVIGTPRPGVDVLYRGPVFEAFERPLPQLVESSMLANFEGYLNQTQAFEATGPNLYSTPGQQFVISIEKGCVTGVLGSIHDMNGREFSQFGPSSSESGQNKELRKFKKLATVIQKYGHMYYHFVQEVLPRIILALPYLDEDTKLLTFGAPHETKWLLELGISMDQIEVYDPSVQYCADELLVPNLSPVVTPPKENYDLLRSTFHSVITLPEAQRNLIIYCTRRHETDRQVVNEEQILASIKKQYPGSNLYIYTGEESVSQTIHLFRQARVVIGMHGAGLSHSIFSSPETSIVEFLFVYDPPMMFWHASGAIGQRYIMVPLPQSWWLDKDVTVPVQDVMDAMAIAMNVRYDECKPGFFFFAASSECLACPAGTYRPAGSAICLPCSMGKSANREGASFCSTCPLGSFSDLGFDCELCPGQTTTMFPGSTSNQQCITVDKVQSMLDAMFDRETLVEKLVVLPALKSKAATSLWDWLLNLITFPLTALKEWRQRGQRFQYLKQLFDSEQPSNTPAPFGDNQVVEHHRSLVTGYQYGRRLMRGLGQSTRARGHGVRRLMSSGLESTPLMSIVDWVARSFNI